jgi:bifunctional non-homologous end joining protein LigD
MATQKLARYQQMRDFTQTAEPSGKHAQVVASEQLRFVIQKHAATRLHFDLRLEFGGVFKSWAVTKGPSLDPHDRRLAVEVEDHPLDYGDFEGTIPKGQYGGGTVQLWDRGFWAPEPGFEDVGKALDRGELKFVMEGGRMHGSWVLVRLKPDAGSKRNNWLLIKHRDEAAVDADGGALAAEDRSIASGRSMAQIAAGSGKGATPFMTASRVAADAVWPTKPKSEPTQEAKPPAKVKAAPKVRSGGAKAKAVAELPAFVEPQLCKSLEKPPAGEGWAHEIKFDGYRMQLRMDDGAATLLTRKGLDWSDRFSEIVASGAGLGGELANAILDGEVVALDPSGAPDFAALQAALSEEKTQDLVFFAFDLLFADGQDLRALPLFERKARLKAALGQPPANVRYVDHFATSGTRCCSPCAAWALKGSSPSGWTRPIDPAAARPGPSRSAARATRWSSAPGRPGELHSAR